MKTTRLSENLASKAFKTNDNKVVNDDGNKTNKTVINSSKNSICMLNTGAIREFTFLISNAKKNFNYLKQAFINALIF